MNGTARQFDADEVRDRAEWRALLARRGLEPMAAGDDPGFAGRVMAAIRSDGDRRRRTRLVAVRGAVAAAAAVAVLLAVAVLERGDGPGTSALVSERGDPAPSAADWLASRQLQDGAWSEDGTGEAFRPAITALAAMALAGEDATRHASAVASAVSALEAMQNADGSFGASRPHALYNHAFASFALIDEARRNGKGLTPAIRGAVAFALSSQNAFAVWGYPGTNGGDDALTVWELGFLAGARSLGWRDSDGALRRGLAALGRRGGTAFDYRFAIGRESSPRDGGLALTRIATRTLVPFIDTMEGQGTLAGNLLASLDAAAARVAGDSAKHALASDGRPVQDSGGVCAAAVALLEDAPRPEP